MVTLPLIEAEEIPDRRKHDKLRSLVESMTPGELVTQAFVDPVTGCYNRAAFDALHSADEVLAVADIDSLKWVNDCLSYQEGDALIRSAAEYLRRRFGAEVVFRVGGDEFYIVDLPAPEYTPSGRLSGVSPVLSGDVAEVISYGYGAGLSQANKDLHYAKVRREVLKQRAPRGERPPWAKG